MFNQIPERQMHRIRWILTSGWLILIISLFYDPITPILTDPNNNWSPFSLDINQCIKVQGICLKEQTYPMGTEIFWGLIIPSAIFILLVFGHELWRRICPLSFLSQIPRALGIQRQFKKVNQKTGKVKFELAKIKADSWLGRNYLYLQLGWFYVGLCSRILFINSNRIALAIWLILTIITAITVGYLYGGKSWCNYFCPMSPVQKIYGEPRGLFASKAHEGEQIITQSMCRIIDQEGKEQSACVACQSPCIDIDSERTYWDSINDAKTRLLYYGYMGIVVGYFLYYYLYAGNWAYYFSGVWAHQENQLQTLLNPGFYLFNTVINIPKIIAVPLTLGLFMFIFYWGGIKLEKQINSYLRKQKSVLTKEEIQHRIYSICTFLLFNFFFIFGGRSFINQLPIKIQFLWESLIVVASTIWLYKNWARSPKLYRRESLATRFRKQLKKLQLNFAQFLEGTSLNDLDVNEVYVLAKVLPSFTKEKRHQAYKGVVKEALEEGYVDSYSSLEVLRQMRIELDISDEEHRQVLGELGVEDPELFNPSYQHTKENMVRLTGYKKALERILNLQQKTTIQDLLNNDRQTLNKLRKNYSITPQEEAEILQGLDGDRGVIRRAEFLLNQLTILSDRYHALNQPFLLEKGAILTVLRDTVKQKKSLIIRAILEILEQLQDTEIALNLAQSLGDLETNVLQDVLANSSCEWYQRLSPEIINKLKQPQIIGTSCSLELTTEEIIGHLQALIVETNPLIQAICLYMIACLDLQKSQTEVQQLIYDPNIKNLVKETGEILLKLPSKDEKTLASFPTLEKIIYLANSNFFQNMKSETLIELGNLAEIRSYQTEELITEQGDTCRELLLLIEGKAEIHFNFDDQEKAISSLLPGQILDELEVLSHGEQAGTIMAKATPTRVLAIPVDGFDLVLDTDPELAKMVLEMETRHIQQLIKKSQMINSKK